MTLRTDPKRHDEQVAKSSNSTRRSVSAPGLGDPSDEELPGGLAAAVAAVLGDPPEVGFRAYDGSNHRSDAAAVIVIKSPDAFSRILSAPGQLGAARAYVAGDLDVEGDLLTLLQRRHALSLRLDPLAIWRLVRIARRTGVRLRYLKTPPQEVRLRGRRHSKRRDAEAIRHHYEVGNDFYRLMLGPTMTYSCAVWSDPGLVTPRGLDAAQRAKHDLVCQKLGVRPGMRLLDVGCGWGELAIHAARQYGAQVVGVTISEAQVERARARVREAGVANLVEIRCQDYRELRDGPFDAISSIGMFEHVGQRQLRRYFGTLFRLLRPGGRLLNHGIARPPGSAAPIDPNGFIGRYIFPDGELVEVGEVISTMQRTGFEVRDLENLREHYALTLRAWLANLESHWDEAVEIVGLARARTWRLYLAACTAGFDEGLTQVHQVLAVKLDDGISGVPLRPCWRGPVR
ncbi:MAG: cyclopropane-fatty-acyl-phospholipid synthase family protein [Acidimicrobiales bacterium]|nr:cyclopropane-fatty-acyl-phospholipid synthase family protein [Acidimicrobiales bacterium]